MRARGIRVLLSVAAATIAVASCDSATKPPTVTTIVVTPPTTTLHSFGATQQLSAVAQDEKGNAMPGKTFTWSSTNDAIVSVSTSALATAIADGSVTISATTDGVTGTATMQVAQAAATVAIDPTTGQMHSFGQTLQLSATARDAQNNVITSRSPTWGSSAGTIAQVSTAGLVTAQQNGSATITATMDGVNGSAAITVAQVVASVTVAPPSNTLTSFDETVQLTATLRDALNNLIAGRTTTWGSSANGIATVSTEGLVTAKDNGSATMTATADAVNGTATVTVNQAAAKLAFVAQPLTTQTTVTLPAVTVEIQDALSHKVATATNDVTIALGNAGGATLSGTKTVGAINGTATFSGLSVDNAAVGYTLGASAASLTGATSAAFEIMTVAARADSAVLASTTITIGGQTSYSLWITNGAGRDLTGVIIQGYMEQGAAAPAAGGRQANCTPVNGVVPHGTCMIQFSINAPAGQGLVPGPAMARLDFVEGGTTYTILRVPVTLQ